MCPVVGHTVVVILVAVVAILAVVILVAVVVILAVVILVAVVVILVLVVILDTASSASAEAFSALHPAGGQVHHLPMELVDVHCHLFMEPLSRDPEAVLERARDAGVRGIIVPAYDLASWPAVADLARRPGVHAMYGLHPWVADQPLDLNRLQESLSEPEVVGVGEIGLDFKVPSPGREVQLRTLEAQLDLAVQLDLPVALHCRGAFEEMLAVLAGYAPKLSGLVHAFTRGPQLAERFLALGLHLSYGGGITRRHAKRARRGAAVAPLGRLLLETDAPSIGLQEVPPEQVEPRHVRPIAQALAEIRGMSVEEVAAATTENAKRLFRIDR